jgi:hypothetical protein
MNGRQHHVTDAPAPGARQYDQTGNIWLAPLQLKGILESERSFAYPENGEVLGRLYSQPLRPAGRMPLPRSGPTE